MDQVSIRLPRPNVKEGSAFTATAYFRDRATAAASAPSTAKYRIDCLTTEKEIKGWTTLTPAASISISIVAADNAIQDESNAYEIRRLTVAGNPDLTTQVRETADWMVTNLLNVP